MKTSFREARFKKFVLGVREHATTDFWDIDYRGQMKEECLDLYNYADGMGGLRAWFIKKVAVIIWKVL